MLDIEGVLERLPARLRRSIVVRFLMGVTAVAIK
jgi:hypothetical protein